MNTQTQNNRTWGHWSIRVSFHNEFGFSVSYVDWLGIAVARLGWIAVTVTKPVRDFGSL